MHLLSEQGDEETRTLVGPKNSDIDQLEIVTLEQRRRVEHIRDVCHRWKEKREEKVLDSGPVWVQDSPGRSHLAFGNEVWRSESGDFDQHLKLSSHLVHWGRPAISYCWIHKGMINQSLYFPSKRFQFSPRPS